MLVKQYGRFIVIGGLATLAHLGVFAGMMEATALPALIANAVAFLVAVIISFVGHYSWTYREHTHDIPLRFANREFARFVVAALVGLALNSVIVWVTTGALHLSYQYALLPMATVVPVLVFLIGRYWVFPDNEKRKV